MIYLGEQKQALNRYSEEVICWLKIKLKGKNSKTNPDGHDCGKSSCMVCSRQLQIKKDLNPNFVRLFNDRNLHAIICSKPRDLVFKEVILCQMFMRFGYTKEDFKNECEKLFVKSGYEDFFYSSLNYRLAEWLDIHTCTYCNRQYTMVIRKPNGNKAMVPQFDHWFAKSEHPVLALSFYNLVPSCGICNSSIKSTATLSLDNHFHPYVDDGISNSFRFSYLAKSPNNYEVICKSMDNSSLKAQNTIDIMETKLLYKGHSKKELQDLIDLRYKYSDNYLNTLLNKTFKNLEVSKSDKYRMIFGIEIDESNYHKRPFSKFKKDIVDELIRVTKRKEIL
tara:strand:+ start:1198 stop:2205 length:1008 start_codon:yes stop_codon:yes gene_type:complete